MKDENQKSKGKKFKILPLKEKKKALELLKSGEMTLAEISKLYGVNSATIIQYWGPQVERGKDRLAGGYKLPSHKLRIKVVREVISGSLTMEDAMHQYDIVCKDTIIKWIAKYSGQIAPERKDTSNMSYSKPNSQYKEQPGEKNGELEKALEEANLKIIALETMINIAEDRFKIEIRKKYGTKQLE